MSSSDSEVDRMREVATDRLMFMRLMEKAINEIDSVLGSLKRDVYTPPEKSYTNVNIEETPHGFKIYRDGSARPFAVIPHSSVKQVIYDRGE